MKNEIEFMSISDKDIIKRLEELLEFKELEIEEWRKINERLKRKLDTIQAIINI